jgi:uncharacterized membrane protein YkvA (DUF1232 family)
LATWTERARALKLELQALAIACRQPEVPWYAKALGLAVIAYALSPIDLIPDFIPVLGYLDDLVVIPLGVLLMRRWIPADVWADCRVRAEVLTARPVSRVGAALVIGVWLFLAGLTIWLIRRYWGG